MDFQSKYRCSLKWEDNLNKSQSLNPFSETIVRIGVEYRPQIVISRPSLPLLLKYEPNSGERMSQVVYLKFK